MRLSRALLVSILVTLALTLVLEFIFGPRAFGLFLFLPFGLLFKRRRDGGDGHGPDTGPIEPK